MQELEIPQYYGDEGEVIAVNFDLLEVDAKEAIRKYIEYINDSISEEELEQLKKPLSIGTRYRKYNETYQEDEWYVHYSSNSNLIPDNAKDIHPVWFFRTDF